MIKYPSRRDRLHRRHPRRQHLAGADRHRIRLGTPPDHFLRRGRRGIMEVSTDRQPAERVFRKGNLDPLEQGCERHIDRAVHDNPDRALIVVLADESE